MKSEFAIFAAGCFWGVEETFRKLPGVLSTAVGYTGGAAKNPSYEQVCMGLTGHAEAVLVEFDPSKVSFEKLLDVFWANHNPTTYNRQGPDIGEQYRSGIFFTSPEQEKIAKESKDNLERSKKWRDPIVTEIMPQGHFWKAEDYHQQYLAKRGLGNCHL